MTQTVNQNYEQYVFMDEGQILFPPLYGTTTYLIDRTGAVNHTWSSSYTPGAAVYWLGDETILRTIRTIVGGGGSGGGVQEVQWDGTVVWDFRYNSGGKLSHHDIEPLPNGNILMIAWETKTRAEAIDAGRNPYKLQGSILRPDHIIEVEPTGPTSGDIVWEWYVWDHLIQDYDPSKENYGVVEDHPELVDINFGSTHVDWLHTNSIDYHEEFDQILLSVNNFNEIWVIDHSTTTEEAAGHTGGNSGKGGDLLYRWGNPQAYGAGNSNDRKYFNQHDATWVEEGCPGEGNILVFNNGVNRPNGRYSSVDEIEPPVDSNGNYFLEPGSSYGPEEQIWIYTAEIPTYFYSHYVGGAQRLSNGNTLICEGSKGKFFEVTPEKDKIWEYINPYPNSFFNDVFKIQYILPEEPPPPEEPDLDCIGSLSWDNVDDGATVHGSFQVINIGGPGSELDWEISEYPNWGEWTFTPESGENLTPEDEPVTVQVTAVAPNEQNKVFEGYIIIVNQEDPEDNDVIPVHLTTPRKRTVNLPFLEHIKHHLSLFQIIKLLLQRFGQ